MIKVAIVNDVLIALEALRRVISKDDAYELIWSAKSGVEAVALCAQHRPDLMLMDLLMPEMDGVETTRQIMTRSPCAILLVTASPRNNTTKIFEAMSHGALDVVSTPDSNAAAQQLLAKMATVTAFIGKSIRRRKHVVQRPSAQPVCPALPPLVVIGASTGGPKAIAQILSDLPADSGLAVVIVQHIDQQFSAGLASWLNAHSALTVSVARQGDRPRPNHVLVAGTNNHLVMNSDRTLTYTNAIQGEKDRTPYHPSVDIFFESVAQHWPQPGHAALLTGMGCDGAAGLAALRTAKWHTIAESEASCIVYGMPRAAVEIGAADQVLAIGDIASILRQAISPLRCYEK